MDDNMLLSLALDAGEIMLISGAETHRVEDTMERILSRGGNNMPEAVALSTMLIVSIHSPLSGSLTMTRKVPQKNTHFAKICRVNELSRRFVAGQLGIEEAYRQLGEIYKEPSYSSLLTIASYGIASAAFTVLFWGGMADGMVAFCTGILLGIFMRVLSSIKTPYFLNSLIGGIFAGLSALFFYHIGWSGDYKIVIVSSIMPLLPGVTITNAIRDILEGNFLSGTSKVMEAALIGMAVAGGVGVSLSIFAAYFA
jgi:uncharacterized membrane protein YjjP (DUF1212 family)